MTTPQTIKVKSLKTTFSDIIFYTQALKVKDVLSIYYVAVRGKDEEEGAVQRILNKRRIKSIKDFILSDNMFFNTFILNWTDKNFIPKYNPKESLITIPIFSSAAQVIDGQHRIVGLEAAIEEDNSIEEKEILISICIGLATNQAANIFLNINSEQKPVPKSLIYDLFGEVEADKDHAINRANDIAKELNDNPDSPYYKAIKYPGMPRGSGIIDLSTIVSSLKNHLEIDGAFTNYNLKILDYQKQVVFNYFIAIKFFYDLEGFWHSKTKNPFLKSSGFYGAIDYLTSKLLMKCADNKSFSVNTFKLFLALDKNTLLLHDDIKHLDGKTARSRIQDYLESNFIDSLPKQDEYEF